MRMKICLTSGLAVMVIALAPVMLSGCKKSPPPPISADSPSSNDATGVQSSVTLQKMLADLDADPSQAVAALLDVDWSNSDALFSGTDLGMSEADYISLSSSERLRIGQQNVDLLARMRELARAVIADGSRAASQGDKAQAEKCFGAVLSLGEALSESERMELVQGLGKALQSLAQKNIDTLSSE